MVVSLTLLWTHALVIVLQIFIFCSITEITDALTFRRCRSSQTHYQKNIPISSKLQLSTMVDSPEGKYLVLSHSDWGILSVSGPDKLRFLHSLGTNSFEDKKIGSVVPNCFLNGKGKLIDYTRCLILSEDVKVLCSAACKKSLLDMLRRSIFPADKVDVQDVSEDWGLSLVMGPDSGTFLDTLGLGLGSGLGTGDVTGGMIATDVTTSSSGKRTDCLSTSFNGSEMVLVTGCDLGGDGNGDGDGGRDVPSDAIIEDIAKSTTTDSDTTTTGGGMESKVVVSPGAVAGWTLLVKKSPDNPLLTLPGLLNQDGNGNGNVLYGADAWEVIRILSGRPAAASVTSGQTKIAPMEISNTTSPLELGLLPSIHFGKGCFVGQEIVSKAVASPSSRRRIVGIRTVPHVPSLSSLDTPGDDVGVITSFCTPGTDAPAGLLDRLQRIGFSIDPCCGYGLALLSGSVAAASPGTRLAAVSTAGTSALDESLSVSIALETTSTLSFPRFSPRSSPSPPVVRVKPRGQLILDSAADKDKSDAEKVEMERRAAKLEAMARKVAALQSKKKTQETT
eukprot:gene2774-5461_t